MVGKQDALIEQIYNKIKHIIDDVYRPKGISSENIRKYFLHKKNFNKLLSNLKELKFIYGDNKFPLSFDEQVRDILFNRILKDRIYYEKDNPQNESYLKDYESFINSNKS
jgi:hypothetical protein